MTDPALLAVLERIAAAVERLADQRTAADPRMAMLLRATYAALGDEPFTASRVVELARSPVRPALAHAVAASGAKSIGKRLSAHVGVAIDGLRLERIGRGRPAVYRLTGPQLDFDCHQSRFGNPWRT
jgi:hypothetical protein